MIDRAAQAKKTENKKKTKREEAHGIMHTRRKKGGWRRCYVRYVYE
jgi:hypothetical protein